jgi:hypothetical protein
LSKSLNKSQRHDVDLILNDAKDKIISLSSVRDDKMTLNQIASKVLSSGKKIDKFGVSLANLLKMFTFHDGKIMNEHYNAKLLHNGDWHGFINRCRNEVVHEGYLDYKKIGSNPQELITVMRHIHDLLLRKVFTMLCYNGTYNSPIINHRDIKLDWVKQDTAPKDLGYDI